MKKIRIAGFALFAVLVFSAFAASSAFAETEWLLNGNPITGEDSVLTEGEFKLDQLEFGVLVVDIDCSVSFVGTIGPGAQDLVNEVWNLGETVKIGAALAVGTGLSCEVLTSVFQECGPVGSLVEVWPDNLPWTTKLELINGVLVDDFPAPSGYHILCDNGKENLCVGLSFVEKLTNETGGVSGELIEANNEQAECTKGIGHLGSITPGLTQLLAGDTGTLTVS